MDGTFVLLDERSGELRGHNQSRAEQRFSPASTFKIANALIGLSLGAVASVDALIPYTGDAIPFMREWLEPMGLRGSMTVSNVPLYQELARRISLQRMREAIGKLDYGNQQIGTNVTTFWLRGPLAISAVEQTRFLSALAHQRLPFPAQAQRQVAEITRDTRRRRTQKSIQAWRDSHSLLPWCQGSCWRRCPPGYLSGWQVAWPQLQAMGSRSHRQARWSSGGCSRSCFCCL
jgi:beta-lactamase class D